jgi:hypothetical protein
MTWRSGSWQLTHLLLECLQRSVGGDGTQSMAQSMQRIHGQEDRHRAKHHRHVHKGVGPQGVQPCVCHTTAAYGLREVGATVSAREVAPHSD